MSLAGKDAQIYVTGTSQSMTDEACDPIGSGTPVLQWQVTDHDRDILDPSVSFTVEVSTDGGSNWSTASASNYTLRYLLGVIEFDSDPFSGSTSDNDVRISGSYLPYYSVLEGHSVEITYTRELYETTNFSHEGVERGASSPLEVSGGFSLHKVIEQELDSDGGSEPTLREILLGEETHGSIGDITESRVFRVEPNTSQDSMMGLWCKFSDESLSTSIGALQEREISLEANQQDAAMSTQVARVGDMI